jgi:hypothetical protein
MNVIVTGASGMVGEGVMYECLQHPDVERVLVLGRRHCGWTHPKLKKILVPDMFDLTQIESELSGYDACYFCLGVSSVGMKEDDYRHITYDLTMNAASTLARLNHNMTFCYVSGRSTDSSENGRLMWARVKGKTENDLMKLTFKSVYNFRPGFMKPTAGMKNTLGGYKYFSWMYPALRALFPASVSTLKEVGLAMINVTLRGYPKHILEVNDIVEAAK